MQQLPQASKKLVLLRRFAIKGLYSTEYLSQLVQRKKLKAKKLGRNFCTTREWFEEYLSQHALDETRVAYDALFKKLDSEQRRVKHEVIGSATYKNKKNINIINQTAVIVIMAVFILFIQLM